MSGIKLTWKDTNKLESGYEVYRNGSPLDSLSSPLAVLSGNVTEYTDTVSDILEDNYYTIAALQGTRKKFSPELHVPAWTPYRLFQSNEQGVWYDPSDLSTLYQDAAGTIPVTADGDPVGLMLDKSKGLELGPDTATNGGFDTDSGWAKEASWTISGGVAVGNGTGRIFQSLDPSISVGSVVEITYTIVTLNSGTVRIDAGNGTIGTARASPGTYTERLGVSGALNLYINQVGRAFDGTLDNISVREIKGNHATQSVSAYRPVYQRGDSRGVVNLLKWSEDATNPQWAFTGGSRTGGQLSSRGDSKAVLMEGPTSSPPIIIKTAPASGAYTASLALKYNTRVSGQLLVRNNTTSTNYVVGVVNFQTGQITGTGWTSKPLDNGFYLYNFTQATGITAGDSLSLYYGGIGALPADFDVIADYAQLEQDTTATEYQRNDSRLGGVATGSADDLQWLAFDGVDDHMIVSSTLTSDVDAYLGMLRGTTARSVMFSRSVSSSEFVGLYQSGQTSSSTGANSGAPTYYTNGGIVTPTTRWALDSAIPVGQGSVIEVVGVDMSTWGGFTFGRYIAYEFSGQLFQMVIRQTLTESEAINLRDYTAQKSGVGGLG